METMGPYVGGGYGPDRHQRLAHTSWIEDYFSQTFAETTIELHTKAPADPELTFNPSVAVADRGTLVKAFDPVAIKKGGAMDELASGLLAVCTSPFLRGKVVSAEPIELNENETSFDLPRNFGDVMAFKALYAEMAKKGMFDWTPDGIVLSKLEGPTGDVMASSQIDAKQAQLFNVAVQGPAIARNWRNMPLHHALPLDKVYVLIVADVVTGVGAGGATQQIAAYDTAQKAYVEARTNYTNTFRQLAATAEAKDALYAKMVEKRDALASFMAMPTDAKKKDTVLKTLTTAEENLKMGDAQVKTCKMTNFRLMRASSSYLANYSSMKSREPRCGLPLGTKLKALTDDDVKNLDEKGKETEVDKQRDENFFAGAYIVGGWEIGTVLDSAASRATVGNTVRTAPASMLININVHVQWWSGDALHRAYMDLSEDELTKDVNRPEPHSTKPAAAPGAAAAGADGAGTPAPP